MTASPSSAARTLGALGLLGVLAPVNLAATALALAARPRTDALRAEHQLRGRGAPRPRTVLVSGGKMTKALQLARSFHAAGHRVILVESATYRLTGHRFSRAVDRFYVVPKPYAPDYAERLLEIVQREGVDVYVPVCSPAASYYDGLAKEVLSPHCEVIHLDADMVATLDDKYEFSALAASLGLSVPTSFRITDPQQIIDFDFSTYAGDTFILKSIAYDSVRRLDLTRLPRPTPEETAAFARSLPISEDNPWIMQAFVDGQEYCTHSTVRDGRVQVYCCCRSSAFQVNYEMVDKPEIEAWVEHFSKALGLTGQVSMDFMEDAEGRVYAIECNPRTHSAITMFYNHPDVARAYLDDDVETLTPLPSSRPTYWLYHELWRMVSRPASIPERLEVVLRGKEAIFDRRDPLPFLFVHHLQIPSLLLDNLRRGRTWIRIDFNIGKLVEPGGD